METNATFVPTGVDWDEEKATPLLAMVWKEIHQSTRVLDLESLTYEKYS
jgi:hypothetical protein